MKQENLLTALRENLFFISCLLFAMLLPFSEALVSICAGLLLIQALALLSWKHPSVPHGYRKSLAMILLVFMVYAVGMIFTEDIHFALYELRKIIFWIIIPVAFFISPALKREKFLWVVIIFCLAVITASLLGITRLIFSNYFNITDFRKIILISHIRYSFQVVLAIIFLSWFLLSKITLPVIGYKPVILSALIAWLIYFLILLKSITGMIVFAGTAIVFLIVLITYIKSLSRRILFAALIIIVVATPIYYISRVLYNFYNLEVIDPQKVEKTTPSGNYYSFDFASKEKENGHWVRAWLCEPEVRKEWNKVSECNYDSLDKQGYPYSATVIRYLTSKGLRKDSAGVRQLTAKDIQAIEKGLANHIYVDRTFSLYPRIYESIWELDVYFRSGDPNNQSVSQRIEFVKASLLLIKQNPWFGIGTGNWKIRYAEAYQSMNSKLYPENQGPSHNQYINYLVKFGITGFLFIAAVIMIPVFLEGHQKNLIFWLFLVSIGLANFGDANLETHMGLSFFSFFYCLFLWHSPGDLRNFHL